MDLPWLRITLSSVVGSFCLVQFAPRFSLSESYLGTFSILTLVFSLFGALWRVVLWPKFFSPLRHLPHPTVRSLTKIPLFKVLTQVKDGSFFNGQFKRIRDEPSGVPHQEWINSIPNDGLIYYTGLLNAERLLITSPQALGEVLTTKSYDFIKPAMVRNGLGRILGTGLILAEGDEHKVSIARTRYRAFLNTKVST